MLDRERQSIELELESSDEEIRRLAVERLAALPAADALPGLLACLGDPGWRVRKAAVDRLVEAPAAWSADAALVTALSDGENPGRRNSAAEALIRRGESAVDSLLEATASDDVDVRKLAVDTLAGIAAPRALDRLLEMLDDVDPNVRAAAADALAVVGDDAVAPLLLSVATRADDDPLVAFSALQALARLEVSIPAQELLRTLDTPLLRPAAYAVMGQAADEDESAVEVLLKGLQAASRSGREAAISALLRLVSRRDDAAAEALAEQIRSHSDGLPQDDAQERLASADLPMRLVLIQYLGLLGRAESAVPILSAGRDEALEEVALSALAELGERGEHGIEASWSQLDAEDRCLACRALARTSGVTGNARLVAALDDPDTALRSAAALALGVRRCADALPALVHRLEAVASLEDDLDGEDERSALTTALIELTQPVDGGADLHDRTVELLGQRLDGAPEPVRLALATVLGRIGRPQDERLVAWLLKDPSPGVRRAAVQALARLGHGEDAEPLRLALADEASAVRIAAAAALAASHSPRALGDLEHLADDEDPRVRAAALRAVGERAAAGGEEASRQARDLLAGALGDEGAVALAAVEALQVLGGESAAVAARSLLERDEPELVRAAASCIGLHGERGALEDLVPLVGHPDWSVRAEVIGALAERAVVASVPAILRRLETEQDDFVRDAILRALRRLEG
jgi:HEAT repeat protein